MCVKSKIFLVGLVLGLASLQLWALPPKIVGTDSRDAMISNQVIEIRGLEDLVKYQEKLLAEKENEIETLQKTLDKVKSESNGLNQDSETLMKQLETLKTESKMLKKQLSESKEELTALQILLTEAQKILNEPVKTQFNYMFYAGGSLGTDDMFDIKTGLGFTYGMLGFMFGIESDLDADFFMPDQWTYEAAMQIYF